MAYQTVALAITNRMEFFFRARTILKQFLLVGFQVVLVAISRRAVNTNPNLTSERRDSRDGGSPGNLQ